MIDEDDAAGTEAMPESVPEGVDTAALCELEG
jgi:hypothetical protein